jgi:hypothetical protein
MTRRVSAVQGRRREANINREALKNLVKAILTRVRDKKGFCTKTKLILYLYLIDVEYYRRHGQTLTGWEWQMRGKMQIAPTPPLDKKASRKFVEKVEAEREKPFGPVETPRIDEAIEIVKRDARKGDEGQDEP